MALSLHMRSAEEWRKWLESNRTSEKEVWLIFFKGKDHEPCISYDDALDTALCYGWIDSLIQKIDEERYARKFTPRTNAAKWSAANKRRVVRLIRDGRMTESGLACINDLSDFSEEAREDHPQKPDLPPEVEKGLRSSPLAWENFNKLAFSYRRNYIGWLSAAKRPETLQKRLSEAIALLERGELLGMK